MSEHLKKSNNAVFDKVFRQQYSQLKRYVSGLVGRRADVEDIVQETFLRSFNANKDGKIENVQAYCYKAARNLSYKHNAKHSNKFTSFLEDLGVVDSFDFSEVSGYMRSIEEDVESHEQFAIFCEAVRDLPLQCRRVFILKRVYGLSAAEIAERLSISTSTVSKHLAKGLTRCTIYMKEHGHLAMPAFEQINEKRN